MNAYFECTVNSNYYHKKSNFLDLLKYSRFLIALLRQFWFRDSPVCECGKLYYAWEVCCAVMTDHK